MRAAPAFACLRDGAAVVGIILQFGLWSWHSVRPRDSENK
jgi:hypothetical protein